MFAAPWFQQLENMDGTSSRGDEEAAGVGGELELVGREQQLGHFGDLEAGKSSTASHLPLLPSLPESDAGHAGTSQPPTAPPCCRAAHHPPHLLDADTVTLILHSVEVEVRGRGVADPAATGRDAAAVNVLWTLEERRG